MSKTSSSLLSFLLGAGAGFAAGILFAPDKGSNTRDKLSFQLDRYRKHLEALVEELLDGEELNDSTARSEGKRVISEAKEKAEALLGDVDELIAQIRSSKPQAQGSGK